MTGKSKPTQMRSYQPEARTAVALGLMLAFEQQCKEDTTPSTYLVAWRRLFEALTGRYATRSDYARAGLPWRPKPRPLRRVTACLGYAWDRHGARCARLRLECGHEVVRRKRPKEHVRCAECAAGSREQGSQ